jgi:uncharacterized membrane protein YeaQ/YmgE (transglycosylase-associated protein family)
MSLVAWLVVGLLAGWLASMVVNRRGEGMLLDILLGVVGAFVGGIVFHFFGHAGVNGINVHSIIVATVGAIVFLLVYHALFRRRTMF